jgi:signal transduction histidine kinase
MLVLGPRRRQRQPPFRTAEVRLLSLVAGRVALAVENHLYQREMIESERTTLLGTMAGMLAHDFRGPMTVIRGYAETFLEPGISLTEVRARAEVIMQMVDRLDRMATETLDFARGRGPVVRRQVDLLQALDQILDGIEHELPGLMVERRLALPRAATAWLDIDKLHRVVGNIAANAREAMGGVGRLIASARVDDTPGETRLVLTLADDGPGVAADIRDRLFEPFVTHGKRRGTGLGLAVARRFIEDHEGKIDLLPPRDDLPAGAPRGARFRIILPLAPTGDGSGRRADAAGGEPPGSREAAVSRDPAIDREPPSADGLPLAGPPKNG